MKEGTGCHLHTINLMSYTRPDGGGNVLSNSARFLAVRDNVTGLIKVMKTNYGGVKRYNNPIELENI